MSFAAKMGQALDMTGPVPAAAAPPQSWTVGPSGDTPMGSGDNRSAPGIVAPNGTTRTTIGVPLPPWGAGPAPAGSADNGTGLQYDRNHNVGMGMGYSTRPADIAVDRGGGLLPGAPASDPITDRINAFYELLNAPPNDPRWQALTSQISDAAKAGALQSSLNRGIMGGMAMGNADKFAASAVANQYLQRQGLAAQALGLQNQRDLGLADISLKTDQLKQQGSQYDTTLAAQQQMFNTAQQNAYNLAQYSQKANSNQGIWGGIGSVLGAIPGIATGNPLLALGGASIGGGVLGGVGGGATAPSLPSPAPYTPISRGNGSSYTGGR